MKESLEYIKKTGEEIKELNNKIQFEMDENKKLRDEINKLESQLKDKECELKNSWQIANKWYLEYEELNCKYVNLEAKHDFVNHAFASLVPRLSNVVEEDYDEGKFFSEIISSCKRIQW